MKAPRPQFILLDPRVPRVNRLGIVRQVETTSALARIPVVVLTTRFTA